MSAHPRHLDALTGIRGIAAWGVVLYHIRLSLAGILPAPVVAALSKGYLAVDLFFVLSGFVIWYNYAQLLRADGWNATRAFWWRRIARIWPLHAAILLGFAGFAALLAVTANDTGNYPPTQFPLHMLLVQNWGLTNELVWNHPAWSISTELAAYLLFPALLAAAKWEWMPSWALLGLCLALAVALHLLFALNGDTSLGADIPKLGLWRCLAEFSMGNLLCILWQRWRSSRHGAGMAATACLLLTGIGLTLGLPETAFVPATFFTGILALALGSGPLTRTIASTPLRYLGEISYSTYLSHFGLFIVYKLAFVDTSLQLGWIGLVGFLLLVLAASVALYHGLEKPAQRWLNRHPPRWAIRTAPLAAE